MVATRPIADIPIADVGENLTQGMPSGMEIYRHREGYLVSVSKNRIRGHGRALQLRFQSNGDKDFNLLGWGVYVTKNTNV